MKGYRFDTLSFLGDFMVDIYGILKQMTLDEKIGQLAQFNANVFVSSDAEITGPMADLDLTNDDLNRLGSVLNFKDANEMIELQKRHLQGDRNKIPMLFMMDVIHGYKTCFPIPLALGGSFDTELVEECSALAAKEAAAAGVHVTFTPMVDYVRDARWGRVMETCGEDVMLNSLMGAAQIRGFHGDDIKKGLATCVKHFAGYGGAEGGRDYNAVELSEHTLREYYLPAYKACIDAGVDMLMPSFNVLNGIPSLANEWLMRDVLRDEWGFDGVVISDYNAVKELITHGIAENKKAAAKYAFQNGCDIEMCSNTYFKHIKELIDEGVFSEEKLDESVMKILKLKEKLGLFENPYGSASVEAGREIENDPKNRALVRRAANESAVLLKNNGLLPFDKGVKKVALIGPFASEKLILGAWSCKGRLGHIVSVEDGIRNKMPNAEINVVKGCGMNIDDYDTSGINDAVNVAKNADIVILCLGESSNYGGEAKSKVSLNLTDVQDLLAEKVIDANPNTAVVLFTSRPLSITKLDEKAPAILNMWFPGNEGGNSVADLLFGDANPCGKVTMSFPRTVGQCPMHYTYTNTGRPSNEITGEKNAKYASNYLDCSILPLYSFGYGLSYSNFVYEDLKLDKNKITEDDKIKVTVTVYNDSNISGKEVVQLYLRDIVASTARPLQKLIAFKKVEFKAKERKQIEFTIDESMLRIWNNKNEYVSEAGEFEISTGFADHLIFTKKFTLIK